MSANSTAIREFAAAVEDSGLNHAAVFLIQPIGDNPAPEEFFPNGTNIAEVAARLDSGVDIPTPAEVTIPAGATIKIKLGVRARCVRIEDGNVKCVRTGGDSGALTGVPYSAYDLRARSSVGKKGLMLANGVGTIDIGYTGELCAYFFNSTDADYTVAAGEALVQLVGPSLSPGFYILQEPGNDLHFGPTERAAGGFGSTDA